MYLGMSSSVDVDFMVRPIEKLQEKQRTYLMDSQSGPGL